MVAAVFGSQAWSQAYVIVVQAVVMGTRRSLSVSLKDCGICGSELGDYRRHVAGAGDNGGPGAVAAEAASVQLACKHLFHPSCIKGWTLVGGMHDQLLEA